MSGVSFRSLSVPAVRQRERPECRQPGCVERDIVVIPFLDAEELCSNTQSYCKHDLERKIAIAIDRLFCVILTRHAGSRSACLPGQGRNEPCSRTYLFFIPWS